MTDITDAEISAANDFADAWLEQLHERVTRSDHDECAVLYGLWVAVTQVLAREFGWTVEQLTNDLQHHVALATSEGRMQ